MALTNISITRYSAPANASAVQGAADSGNLDDGTYYIRFYGQDGTSHLGAADMRSDPVAELTCVCNQGDGRNSIVVTWDDNPNLLAYYFVISTVSGDYSGNTGVGGNTYYPTVLRSAVESGGVCTYNITDSSVLWKTNWTNINGQTAYSVAGVQADLGNLRIDFDGDGTLSDLLTELDSQGYSDYYYYDGKIFVLHGGFKLSGSSNGSLTLKDLVIYFLWGGVYNGNSNFDFAFGEIDGEDVPGQGCQIKIYSVTPTAGYMKWFNTVNLTMYGCLVKNSTNFKLSSSYEGSNNIFEGMDKQIEGVNGHDLTLLGGRYYPRGYGGTNFHDLVIYGDYSYCLYLYGVFGDTKWYDCSFYRLNCSYHVGSGGSHSGLEHDFYDCFFDQLVDGFPKFYGASTPAVEFRLWKSVNFYVEDPDGNPVNGATVDLQDKDGTYAWTQGSKTTGATGWLGTGQDDTTYVKYQTCIRNPNSDTDHGPFTLTISHNGATYTAEIELKILGTQKLYGQYTLLEGRKLFNNLKGQQFANLGGGLIMKL